MKKKSTHTKLQPAPTASTIPPVDPFFLPPHPGPWTRRDWFWLGLVIGATLAVRLAYFYIVHQEAWFVTPIVDSLNYDQWARRILGGEWIGQSFYIHSPLYAYLMALIYALAGPKTVIMAGFQLFFLAPAAAGLMYILGRRVFSRSVGVIAGLAGAFYGIGIFYEGTLLTVIVIHLLNIGVLISAYWAAGRNRFIPWLVTGIFLGLSTLTRPTVLLFFFVLVAWLWIVIYPSAMQKRLAMRASAALAAGLLLLLAPVTIRNVLVLNEWMLSVPHAGPDFYLGNAKQATGYPIPFGGLGLSSVHLIPDFRAAAERLSGQKNMTFTQSSRFWFRKSWEEIFENPDHWQKLLADKALLFLNRYEFTTSLNYETIRVYTSFLRWPWLHFGWVMPLGLLGMALAWRRWREFFPLYGLVAIYAIVNVSILVSSEYRYAVLPAVSIFAGWAVVELVYRVRQRQMQSLILPITSLCLLGVLCNLDASGPDAKNYNLATGHSNLGNLYARIGDYPRAITEYEIAKEKLSTQPGHWLWLSQKEASVMMDGGLYTEALALLETLYPKSPSDIDLLTLYGNALTALGDYSKAITLRKEAIALEPHDYRLHLNLGITYQWAGEPAAAQEAFAQAIRLDPSKSAEIEQAQMNAVANRDSSPPGTVDELDDQKPLPPGQPPVYNPPTMPAQPSQPLLYQPPIQYQPNR